MTYLFQMINTEIWAKNVHLFTKVSQLRKNNSIL